MDTVILEAAMSNYTNLGNESIIDWSSSIHQTLPTVSGNGDSEYNNISEILGPKRDPLYVVIPITFIYMLIFITGVIGNISTCIVISKNKSLKTATNYYLFSLAVSDFLLLLSGVPQEMYSIWSKYPYVFGEMFCVLRGLVAETSANATVLTITAFTVERYVAVKLENVFNFELWTIKWILFFADLSSISIAHHVETEQSSSFNFVSLGYINRLCYSTSVAVWRRL